MTVVILIVMIKIMIILILMNICVVMSDFGTIDCVCDRAGHVEVPNCANTIYSHI